MSDRWYRSRPPSRPIRVEGGLTLRSKRGDVARTWWSRRFLEVLESFGMGGRLTRGRAYARSGQVMSLSLSSSLVVALVMGSQPRPYRARVAVRKFTDEQWRRVEHALADRAVFAARLLAGEMPEEVEEVFADLGLSLFPRTTRELSMDCTCPDWEVPCKHLAATCYLLAESFDTDPFEIFAWRGRSREELLDRLRALRDPMRAEEPEPRREFPLEDCLESFWQRPQVATVSDLGQSDLGQVAERHPEAVLDELGPLTAAGRSVPELLRPLYRAIAEGS
ncbi:putative Zn finger protein [Saccharothrix coeruleofusca]|uniref:SWIM zinc finger family protein n=1 Tax=Saccharothrix coeruleofusca TaxID=33919 RepID=UPI001AE2FA56|nr:SWIM zinc finger family protein [Saccharothrix coeruleofusca]MBP2334040.1 putative Zn finger protein [Saccharothrix coeruleofusca]